MFSYLFPLKAKRGLYLVELYTKNELRKDALKRNVEATIKREKHTNDVKAFYVDLVS